MDLERYCGLISVAVILLVVTLSSDLGLYGPLWSRLSSSDILAAVVAAIGWTVTISIGVFAFRLAQRQIALAQRQIEQQQEQIDENRREIRRSNFARLDSEFVQFARNIDLLMTAKGYLGNFTAQFPVGQLGGWARQLIMARSVADDVISASAVSAPFGHGERISTVMTRIQRLGELLDQNSRSYMPDERELARYDPLVKRAIEGLRTLEQQISDDIPRRQAQLIKIKDERDSYDTKE